MDSTGFFRSGEAFYFFEWSVFGELNWREFGDYVRWVSSVTVGG